MKVYMYIVELAEGLPLSTMAEVLSKRRTSCLASTAFFEASEGQRISGSGEEREGLAGSQQSETLI